ncbi:tetratricopeptide repeat protein [Runella sp.]|uniref:tetratricopeptide repeat-containing sensor histidine kinase n=1 Tax=Runella sp. TaxID=1960881 RepID=UPI00260791FE|nr:tetratricopeptide repeat protein [Runella sp.]
MPIFILFAVTFCLISTISVAQSPSEMVDSLKKEVQKHPAQDSLQVNRLLTIADGLAYTELDEAMQYANQAAELAEKLQLYGGQAGAQRQKAVIYMNKGDYLNAIDACHRALQLSDKLFERIKDDKGQSLFNATIYNALGAIYLDIEQLDKAIDNFSKLVTIAHRLNEPREEAVGLGNIGEAYTRKGAYRKAIAYFDKAVTIAQKSNDYLVLAFVLGNKGVALNFLEKYTSALPVFEESIKNADQVNDVRFKTISIAGLAQCYFHFNQYDLSEKYAKSAYELAKPMGLIQQQRDAAKVLSMIYEKQNKSMPALSYFKESVTLNDSLISKAKQLELTRRDMKFEQEQREIILNAEIKQKQTERNAVLGIGAILLVAVAVSAFFYKSKRDADLATLIAFQKQQEAEYQARFAEYQALVLEIENKVLRAQMNPHFIFNALNSISSYITKNDSENANEYLAKFAELMRLVLENSDEKLVLLNEDLKALRLYMQLETLRLPGKFSFEITVDKNIDSDELLFPPLILQPLVENSIWHGIANKEGTGKIKIVISKEGEKMYCAVEDNGIGRKKAASLRSPVQLGRKSMGIELTKKRIAIYDNTQNPENTISYTDLEEGTRAEIKLPLTLQF